MPYDRNDDKPCRHRVICKIMYVQMKFRKKTEHLKRYRDLLRLLVKYGQSDLAHKIDLDERPSDMEEEEAGGESKAEDLPGDLEKLGPTYIKLGQFLSSRADFFPPDYLKALSRLQDKVEPIPESQVEEILASELGLRVSKAFDEFQVKPVASASIGQVHKATLRGGKPVAVKVQRPGIRQQIFDDLDAFQDIAWFLQKHTKIGKQLMLGATVEEFRKAMLQELDYLQEARNLSTLSGNLREFKYIVVPRPVEDYTTSRVLTMEYIPGKNLGNITPLRLTEINGEDLAQELFRAYLKQILVDGFFHADPHPGNVYITDTGGIALIDLGMVARIPEDLKLKLTRILIAVGEGEGEKAAKYLISIAEKEENSNETLFTKKITEIILKTRDSPLQQIEVGRLVLEITRIAADNGIILPNEMIMLGKALLNLDRVGRTLDPEFDPNAALRENAFEIIREKMKGSLKPGNWYEALLDTKNFLENLPGRANEIFSLLAANKLTIRTKVIDEKYFIHGLQEAANRLTTGLILAALIIGAALLMNIETTFHILGYPAIAMIFFLLAAIGGLILVFRSIFKDD